MNRITSLAVALVVVALAAAGCTGERAVARSNEAAELERVTGEGIRHITINRTTGVWVMCDKGNLVYVLNGRSRAGISVVPDSAECATNEDQP